MQVFTHNFNPNSNSGPNKFTRQLFAHLIDNDKINIVNNQQTADVEFCLIQQSASKVKPMVLRLDGIYFNSDQDYKFQNMPIKFAYNNSDAVVFQSEFNKKLTEHWFGEHKNSYVIHNAADLDLIKEANEVIGINWPEDVEVWCCASSWRPHKRLKDNIDYFKKYAPKESIMAIAGSGCTADDIKLGDGRIFYLGELDYMSLLALYKRSSTFVHLAYLDHCPNVVVDAQACGCKVICSSTGGTSEIVNNGIVINEDEWDFSPIELYKPPLLNFDISYKINKNNTKTIEDCAIAYYNVFKEVLDESKAV